MGGAGARPKPGSASRLALTRFVEVSLEAYEQGADVLRVAQIGEGVGDRVLIAQLQQRSELVAVELADARPNSCPARG